uniref:Uncharacterized protein n=1 Tax=Mycena chlorophos TaxID=658473 RepID=A0ABQ0LA08_MYCCL|nr:predicted protein [Mycena chlorophos]
MVTPATLFLSSFTRSSWTRILAARDSIRGRPCSERSAKPRAPAMIYDKLDSEAAEAPLTQIGIDTRAGVGTTAAGGSPSQATLVNESSGWVAARGLQYLDLALGPYTLPLPLSLASADVSDCGTRSSSSEAATTGSHRQPESSTKRGSSEQERPQGPLPDAEKRIPLAWKTVDRVLDLNLWRLRNARQKKGKRTRIDSDADDDLEDEFELEKKSVRDGLVEPIGVFSETRRLGESYAP